MNLKQNLKKEIENYKKDSSSAMYSYLALDIIIFLYRIVNGIEKGESLYPEQCDIVFHKQLNDIHKTSLSEGALTEDIAKNILDKIKVILDTTSYIHAFNILEEISVGTHKSVFPDIMLNNQKNINNMLDKVPVFSSGFFIHLFFDKFSVDTESKSGENTGKNFGIITQKIQNSLTEEERNSILQLIGLDLFIRLEIILGMEKAMKEAKEKYGSNIVSIANSLLTYIQKSLSRTIPIIKPKDIEKSEKILQSQNLILEILGIARDTLFDTLDTKTLFYDGLINAAEEIASLPESFKKAKEILENALKNHIANHITNNLAYETEKTEVVELPKIHIKQLIR